MLAVVLGAVAVAALAGMGWMARCLIETTKTLTTTFSSALTTLAQGQRDSTETLVLGRDSPPSSEPWPTEWPENEKPKSDENNLADMPNHIREIYEREAQEDALMATLSSSFSTPPTASSL